MMNDCFWYKWLILARTSVKQNKIVFASKPGEVEFDSLIFKIKTKKNVKQEKQIGSNVFELCVCVGVCDLWVYDVINSEWVYQK